MRTCRPPPHLCHVNTQLDTLRSHWHKVCHTFQQYNAVIEHNSQPLSPIGCKTAPANHQRHFHRCCFMPVKQVLLLPLGHTWPSAGRPPCRHEQYWWQIALDMTPVCSACTVTPTCCYSMTLLLIRTGPLIMHRMSTQGSARVNETYSMYAFMASSALMPAGHEQHRW